MTILKALRSLYKIGGCYIEDNSYLYGHNEGMLRESAQIDCNLEFYCYKKTHSDNFYIYSHCDYLRRQHLIYVISFLNRIEGISAYSPSTDTLIIKEQ